MQIFTTGPKCYSYFDTDYWDRGVAEISDLSGHERHATANGGPTVGVEGPEAFDAVSFDGSDDYFDVGESIGLTTQTAFALARFENLNGNKRDLIATDDGSNSVGVNLRKDDNDDLNWYIYDGQGSSTSVNWGGLQADTWYKIIGLFDGSQITLIAENEVKDETPVASISSGTTNTMKVGANGSESTFMQGDIAIAARWSRAFSWTEIQELNRLTAPIRIIA